MTNTTKKVRAPKTAPVSAQATQGAPAATVAPTPAACLVLSAKALQLATAGTTAANTLQAPQKGLGMAWRVPGYKATNTRALALATILAACGEEFTADQAQRALDAAKKAGTLNLGSGTPNSYVKAFLGNGYFAAK